MCKAAILNKNSACLNHQVLVEQISKRYLNNLVLIFYMLDISNQSEQPISQGLIHNLIVYQSGTE